MDTTKNILFQPVDTQRASEAIYEQISNLIKSGELKPGDRLPSERTMMDMMKRSRPTIREALRMLERSGLIRISSGSSGAVVLEPSTVSIEQPMETLLAMNGLTKDELLEYRELNEMTVAGWAARRRTEQDVEKIQEQLAFLDETSQDFDEFFKHDIIFHQTLASAAGNRVAIMVENVMHQMILNILKKSYEKKESLQQQAMLTELTQSHKDIGNAIIAQNETLARELMREHMHFFKRDVLMEK